jgi:hypothetical protein
MTVDELVVQERGKVAKYLRRDQAAQYVRNQYGFPCSTALLHKLASLGGGPVYRRANRVPLYARSDLDAWAESRISAPMRKASDAVIVVTE